MKKTYSEQIKKLEYKMAKTGHDLSKEIESLKAKKVEAYNRTMGNFNIPNTVGML